MIILSILIPTMTKRRGLLMSLLQSLGTHPEVEILTDCDDGQVTTGNKRNRLIKAAKGEYVVAIDDDDEVTADYIAKILEAARQYAPDVITFNGWMTTDNTNRVDFRIGLNYPYTAVNDGNTIVYLRYPNHLCPIKRSIALQVPFPNKSFGEDYEWATKLRDMGLLKTEVHINDNLYHYKYKSVKP